MKAFPEIRLRRRTKISLSETCYSGYRQSSYLDEKMKACVHRDRDHHYIEFMIKTRVECIACNENHRFRLAGCLN